MRIVALDLGTQTACVVRDPPEPLVTMAWDMRVLAGESTGMRFLRFRRRLSAVLDGSADLVAYERPGHFKSIAANAVMWGLVSILEEECERRGANLCPVRPSQLKRHATGRGNANKDSMLTAAQKVWPALGVTDHNLADALFVARWAEETYGQ